MLQFLLFVIFSPGDRVLKVFPQIKPSQLTSRLPVIQRIGKLTGLLFLVNILPACTSSESQTLYDELGGHETISKMVDNFILEIARDDRVIERFADSNVARFREKIFEHFCAIADGPCQYTGDSMVKVHAGMNITSAEFNAIVEDLIAAMDRTGISLGNQNQLLSRLAQLRPEIIRI